MGPISSRAWLVAISFFLLAVAATPRATADPSLTIVIEYTAGHFRLPEANPDGCAGWTLPSMPPIFVVECALSEGVSCAAPSTEVGFTGVTGGLGGRATCGAFDAEVSVGCSTSAKFPPPLPFPPTYHTCVAEREGAAPGLFTCRALPLEGFSALQLDGVVRCRANLV